MGNRNIAQKIYSSLNKKSFNKVGKVKISQYIIQEALDEREYTEEEEENILNNIKEFNKLGDDVYRNADLKNLTETVYNIVEFACKRTVDETDDWFDERTANRHVKKLKEAYKVFESTALELHKKQQMFEAVYEEMGMILDRYFTIESLDNLEDDDLELDGEKIAKQTNSDHEKVINVPPKEDEDNVILDKEKLNQFTERRVKENKVFNNIKRKLK